MSAAQKPLTLDEFLVWERSQPARYEFDGVQPVAMTGGSRPRGRVGARLVATLVNRVHPPCEAFGPDMKVLTTGRIRYPDASVVCVPSDEDSDLIDPTVVCEVLSPSTALTDRRVKVLEYTAVPRIQVYVLLEQDRPEITIMRRSAGWEPEVLTGLAATLELPEVNINIPLNAIYAT
jgi:Uma2 family endonuclease